MQQIHQRPVHPGPLVLRTAPIKYPSTPYYYDQIGFLVQTKSGYKKLSDLNGKTIGVSQGSSAKAAVEEYASANNLKFDYVQLGSYPELAVSLYA